jgi:hypothetical protein
MVKMPSDRTSVGITPGPLTPEPVDMSFYRVDDSIVRLVVGHERA